VTLGVNRKQETYRPLKFMKANLTIAPPPFNAAFLERRMREHHEWRDKMESQLVAEIVDELRETFDLAERLEIGRGPGKIARTA
jgi:hypothetical protein